MPEFFRFPHTPHIAWLGEGTPRDDKVLSPAEASLLLAGDVRVEEKLDGANLGISLNIDGTWRAQNRGQYLLEPFTGQFSRLASWLGMHTWQWREYVDPNLILFGEWCAARHSLDYDNLPDWFLLFDVYDRQQEKFWSANRRDELAKTLGIAAIPALFQGETDLKRLKKLVNESLSRYRPGPLEGIVIRRDSADWCEGRAKLVRAEFTQVISEHWRSRSIEWNRMQSEGKQ
jgi:ATP-dependent RNA circularization protein (DNA/RNA ligase family)